MLASITPLGERGRRQRWGITVAAYLAGSTAGGATLGGLAGAAGALLPGGWRAAAAAAAAVCAVAVLLDVARPARPVPSIHRQVNEQWLGAFRGWVYGAGFGYQLGLGVVTIVTTALVYATFALAFVAGGAAAGALVGAAFGLARALPVLAVRRVQSPGALRDLHRRFQTLEPLGRRVSLAATVILTLALTGSLVAA